MVPLSKADNDSSEKVLLQVQDAIVIDSDDEFLRHAEATDPLIWPKRMGLLGSALLLAGVVGAILPRALHTPREAAAHRHFSEERGLLHCHTSVGGEKCFRDVDFAMRIHIKHHPDWYEGLTNESSFEEFQEYLHHQKLEDGSRRCPAPCGLEAAKAKSRAKFGFNDECHTSAGGEPCFSHVKYTMKQIPEHPEWYPGLSKHSSFKLVQHYLFKEVNPQGHKVCPKPCNFTMVEDETDDDKKVKCHDSKEGEQCYTHVKVTMQMIQKNIDKHPDWYSGLSKNSSFKEVQEFMYEERTDKGKRVCPRPCGMNETENSSKDEPKPKCMTAKAGSACYNDIHYAMKHVHEHPDWYRGLTNESTADEFQAYLAGGKTDSEGKRCPKPCNAKVVKRVEADCRRLGCHVSQDDQCETAVKGSACYGAVVWAATKGYKDPDTAHKFVGITPKSSFEEVQNRLHMQVNSSCLNKACPCHTSVPGEACYKTVKWVKRYWVKVHPEWYGGNLSNESSFEAFQRRLHYKPHDHRTHCPLPCAQRAWPWRSDPVEPAAEIRRLQNDIIA